MILNSRVVNWAGANKFEHGTRRVDWRTDYDAVFEILLTTICGSDLRISKYGDDRIIPPRVLGHEISARVLDAGNLENITPGDFVAIGADIPCGKCNYCSLGRSNLCLVHTAIGYQLDGGFAEHLVIPNQFLQFAPIVRINGITNPTLYALAEPTGCALNGLKFSGVNYSDEVLIYGGGPIGIILALLSNSHLGVPKEKIVIVEPSAARRSLIDDFGINTVGGALKNVLQDYFPLGASQVFTANSSWDSHGEALKNVRPGGMINFFGGVPKDAPALQLHSNFLHYQEVKVGGSHGSTPEDHKQAVSVISEHTGLWEKLLTKKLPLEDLENALAILAAGEGLKVGVEPN
jgi:L-iditol 2-dehydrogenase